MKNFSEFTTFNVQNPSAIAPKAKKPMPFPLENLDEELGDAYTKMDIILQKIKAAEVNPVNNTKARKSRLESLRYKTNTCLRLIKSISDQSQELFI